MKVFASVWSHSRQQFEVFPVESGNLVQVWPGAWVESIGGSRGPILEKFFRTEGGAWHNSPADRYFPG